MENVAERKAAPHPRTPCLHCAKQGPGSKLTRTVCNNFVRGWQAYFLFRASKDRPRGALGPGEGEPQNQCLSTSDLGA